MEYKYRIITGWGTLDEPVYHVQYLEKGLFGKEWKTISYYVHELLFPKVYLSIEEAQAYIKKDKGKDNFVSEIVSYEGNGEPSHSLYGEVKKKGYRPCMGASVFWLLILIGLIIFGLFYFR